MPTPNFYGRGKRLSLAAVICKSNLKNAMNLKMKLPKNNPAKSSCCIKKKKKKKKMPPVPLAPALKCHKMRLPTQQFTFSFAEVASRHPKNPKKVKVSFLPSPAFRKVQSNPDLQVTHDNKS